eukprot:4523124-Amphidinium_carterae.3
METRDLLHLHEQTAPTMPRSSFTIEAAPPVYSQNNRPRAWDVDEQYKTLSENGNKVFDWDLIRSDIGLMIDRINSHREGGQPFQKPAFDVEAVSDLVCELLDALLTDDGTHVLLKAGTGWG